MHSSWTRFSLNVTRPSWFPSTNTLVSLSSPLPINLSSFLHFTCVSCVSGPAPQDCLCSARDVLDGRGHRLYSTVAMLLSASPPTLGCPQVQLAGFALFYLSVMSVLCAIYVHLAPGV